MQIDWKSLDNLPENGDVAVYDPTMCQGCRIINNCYVLGGIIFDPSGDVVEAATHFTDVIDELDTQTN